MMFSSFARTVLEKQNQGYFRAYEHLHYDGFDENGPQSDLWELIIILEKGNSVRDCRISWYHREDWYDGTIEAYSLEDEGHILEKILLILPQHLEEEILKDLFESN